VPERLVIAIKPHVLAAFVDDWKPKTRALPSATAAQIGRVLLNHLMAEHYMDACLPCVWDEDVDWDAARLTFSQKLSLLGGKGSVLTHLGLVPGFRRLNRIRNQIAHDLESELTTQDVKPMRDHLVARSKKRLAIPTEPMKVIDTFVALACASMLGFIAGFRAGKHMARKHPHAGAGAAGG
jgi:hypothetical protein